MAKCKFSWIALAALLLAGCTTDPEGESVIDSPEAAIAKKLIHTSNNAVAGELIVYVNDDAVESLEAVAAAEPIMTRSGVSDIDEVLYEIGATSIERLFVVDPRHEERLRARGMHRWYIVRFDESHDLDKAALSLARIGAIDRVEFSRRIEKTDWGEPRVVDLDELRSATRANDLPYDDQYLINQWHYINTGDPYISSRARAGADINAAAAWAIEAGSPEIVVAVLDEGVDYTHPDLAANMWVNKRELNGAAGVDDDNNGYKDDIYGYNFVSGGAISWNDPKDSGHGTHVAGTVSAVNNNGIGVCGVAGGSGKNDGVKIMGCQIFVGESNNLASTVRAMQYAANNGACILQCSFGIKSGAYKDDASYEQVYSSEVDALKYFAETKNCEALDGGLIVFAAGNEAGAMSSYPGAYHRYISVTAVSADGLPAYYTNYGPGCNIAAPGGDVYEDLSTKRASVLSTLPDNQYGYMDGTSMACPHVSGIAALGLSYALKLGKTFTVDQYKALILTSVNEINSYLTGTRESLHTLNLADYRGKMGTGTIDAFQVLMGVRGTRCVHIASGKEVQVNLQDYFGSGNLGVKFSSVDISAEDMQRLGMTEAPLLFGNNVYISCTKPGSAVLKVNMIAGGTTAGGGASMGGMLITKELALIVRPAHASNGGWL